MVSDDQIFPFGKVIEDDLSFHWDRRGSQSSRLNLNGIVGNDVSKRLSEGVGQVVVDDSSVLRHSGNI